MSVCLVTGTTLHAVLYKRDSRATIGWVGVIWLSPIIGAVLYIMFGVNRIQRRAKSLRNERDYCVLPAEQHVCPEDLFVRKTGPDAVTLRPFVELVGHLSEHPLLYGNRVTPLINGDEAFPAMLAAIDQAESTVSMCSYIFDNDRAGKMFAAALGRAVERGVEVRVLIDSVGSRYTFPSIVPKLRSLGIRTERFMQTFLPTSLAYSNLRSHRKILVVDGKIGFTGGLNIREGAMLSLHPKSPLYDTHFKFEGPVVAHLQEVFVEDWTFTCGETLSGEGWFPMLEPVGDVLARGIPNGPDEALGEMRTTLIGVLSCARTEVTILTPYFLPDDALSEALNVAALRGVKVNIILPQANNLALVKWASTAMLWQVLQRGCRVWLSAPPFDHTKLMVVDGVWTLLGSANWDPRSLRLNFEFNVECYDHQLADSLRDLIQQRLANAHEVTMAEIEGRSLPARLRDGVARLLSPYL
ncbi:MAG: cardiolipin synthase [Planctomycetota bacterium]|nr:cardiolipin synthase [Planctomycetota bacterium]